jgi:serine/threonine protein kinase
MTNLQEENMKLLHQLYNLKQKIGAQTTNNYSSNSSDLTVSNSNDLGISFNVPRSTSRQKNHSAGAYLFLIDEIDYQKDDQIIGNEKGARSFVFKKNVPELGMVAVKQFVSEYQYQKLNPQFPEINEVLFKTELEFGSKLKHPNIIELLGMSLKLNSLVFELMDFDLHDLLFESSLTVSAKQRLKIGLQIVSALDYMHNHDTEKIYVHRDIKPENILISKKNDPMSGTEFNAKLGDFGLGLIIPRKEECNIYRCSLNYVHLHVEPQVGTKGFMSPERSNSGILSEKDDVYCFGLVLFYLLFKPDIVSDKIKQDVRKGGYDAMYAPSSLHELKESDMINAWKDNSDAIVEARKKILLLAIFCTKADPMIRPNASLIFHNLNEINDSLF